MWLVGWAIKSVSASTRLDAREADDQGLITIQYVVATGISLLLLVILCNGLTNLYVRAAVRDALDDGVRSSVPAGSDATACQGRVDEALRSLVRGAYSTTTQVQCDVQGGVVRADATLRLPSFLPMLMPSWNFELHATARQETT